MVALLCTMFPAVCLSLFECRTVGKTGGSDCTEKCVVVGGWYKDKTVCVC